MRDSFRTAKPDSWAFGAAGFVFLSVSSGNAVVAQASGEVSRCAYGGRRLVLSSRASPRLGRGPTGRRRSPALACREIAPGESTAPPQGPGIRVRRGRGRSDAGGHPAMRPNVARPDHEQARALSDRRYHAHTALARTMLSPIVCLPLDEGRQFPAAYCRVLRQQKQRRVKRSIRDSACGREVHRRPTGTRGPRCCGLLQRA